MHVDPVREVVLAEPGSSTLSAQRLTKLDRQGGRFRHADTLGRRYFPLYHLMSRLLIDIIWASAMMRIHDPETDASLDLNIPWMLEAAFRVQLGRHLDAGGASRLSWEVSGWLAVALYQVVDRDLLP